jgi:hypothetical protein
VVLHHLSPPSASDCEARNLPNDLDNVGMTLKNTQLDIIHIHVYKYILYLLYKAITVAAWPSGSMAQWLTGCTSNLRIVGCISSNPYTKKLHLLHSTGWVQKQIQEREANNFLHNSAHMI